VVFSEEIRIRPGLEPVDVLHGGAIGIGGGRLRHQIDATAALNSGGTGIRVGVTWRGKSELESRISGIEDTLRFSPVFLVNARAFTDLKRFLPESKWAKGLRLSLEVVNLFNDRQDVRDSFGNTPLQYQPAYRDPIGRTVEFEIRKVF
jgi:outer membrane receptor protein involved in Fe transport